MEHPASSISVEVEIKKELVDSSMVIWFFFYSVKSVAAEGVVIYQKVIGSCFR